MVLLLLLVNLAAVAAVAIAFQPDSSYIRSYGSLTIPYPFGTREGCYLDESFLVICSNSLRTSKPLLSSSSNARNANVLSISLDGELRVSTFVKHDCFKRTNQNVSQTLTFSSKFPISLTKDKFIRIGSNAMDTYIHIKRQPTDDVACLSSCDSIDMVKNGSCSSLDCCQTSIPECLLQFYVVANNMGAPSRELAAFNPCNYAFIVKEKAYNFSSLDFRGTRNTLPMVVD